MIRMTIASIRTKGDDQIRLEGVNDLTDLPGQHFLLNLLEPAISVIQTHSMLDTKPLAGLLEFLFTHLSKHLAGGCPCTPNLPSLAPRCRNHHHLRSSSDIFGKSAARTKSLIVWVGEDTQQTHGVVCYRTLVHE